MNITELINCLKWLSDKENGIGIPLVILSRYCNCNAVSIHNYVSGKSLPTGRIAGYIEEGLNQLKEDFNKGMGL